MSIWSQTFAMYEKLRASKLNSLTAAINAHLHDDRYYTEGEVDAKVATTSVRSFVWYVDSELTTAASESVKLRSPVAGTISSAYAYVDTVPSGGSVSIDINKNAATIFGGVSELIIANGASSGSTVAFGTTTLAIGDLLTLDVNVGASSNAADLTVLLEVTV